MSRLACVYVGRCLPTNKAYVGSTLRGKNRALGHIRDLTKGTHSNSYLQRAWEKYGKSKFVWHIVETCDSKELLQREQWWIEFLRAADRRYGFNLLYPVTDKRQRVRSVLSATQIEKWRDPVIREKRLSGLKALHTDPEWKSNRARTMAAKWQDPVWRSKMLKVLADNSEERALREANDPSIRVHRMRGLNQQTTGRV